MGDRDLAAWLGTSEGGAYTFATYTYTDMYGKGNPNINKPIKYRD